MVIALTGSEVRTSLKEPWPCSPTQQGWKSPDDEWNLIPSQEEALRIADICPYPPLLSCTTAVGASRVAADPALRAVTDPNEGAVIG